MLRQYSGATSRLFVQRRTRRSGVTLISNLVKAGLPCPDQIKCKSSDAYATYDDGHGYCFSCGRDFQPGAEGKNLSQADTFTFQFVPWRSLTEDTLRKYGVLTKVDGTGQPVSVGFSYPNGRTQVRTLADNRDYWAGESPKKPYGLFGSDKFTPGQSKVITVTEGPIDAPSAYQMLGGKFPVYGTRSATTAKSDCIADRDILNAYEKIIFCFDNDKAGQTALADVAPLFDFNKVYNVKLTKHKDANDYLRAGDGDEFRRAWWNAQRFLPAGVHSSYRELDAFIDEERGQGIPFPFPQWNDFTYGLRYGESFLIKAPEKVGKSLVMKRLLKHFLETTDVNIGGIFLEEHKGTLLKGLAGLRMGVPAHLPDAGVSNTEIKAALRDVVGRDDRLHLYSHFGSDDLNVLLDTIRFMVAAAGCRIIFFDHISMAVSGLEGDDERRKLDWLMTHLQMLVEDLNFALIFVSHVNDNGQTRGSRYITKVADTTVGLSRDLINPDPAIRNRINCVFEFNRFTGRTGPVEPLIFNHEKYSLEEKGVTNDELKIPSPAA